MRWPPNSAYSYSDTGPLVLQVWQGEKIKNCICLRNAFEHELAMASVRDGGKWEMLGHMGRCLNCSKHSHWSWVIGLLRALQARKKGYFCCTHPDGYAWKEEINLGLRGLTRARLASTMAALSSGLSFIFVSLSFYTVLFHFCYAAYTTIHKLNIFQNLKK